MSQATALELRKRPRVKSDSEAAACEELACKVKFGIFNRRIHCSGCGFIFCHEHCQTLMTIPSMGYHTPVKVCHTCSTHGVQDPSSDDERGKHNQKKKKDKKEKKKAKDRKERKQEREEKRERLKAEKLAAQRALEEKAAPQEESKPEEAAPPTTHTDPLASTSKDELNFLKRKVESLERMISGGAHASPPPRTPSPPPENFTFTDADDDMIIVVVPDGYYDIDPTTQVKTRNSDPIYYVQYKVNQGELRAYTRHVKYHAQSEGYPGCFEFQDIDTAVVMRRQSRAEESDVVTRFVRFLDGHDITLEFDYNEALLIPEETLHAPPDTEDAPVNNNLPSLSALNNPSSSPKMYEPVFAPEDEWSTDSDSSSSWDDSMDGQGKGVAQPGYGPGAMVLAGNVVNNTKQKKGAGAVYRPPPPPPPGRSAHLSAAIPSVPTNIPPPTQTPLALMAPPAGPQALPPPGSMPMQQNIGILAANIARSRGASQGPSHDVATDETEYEEVEEVEEIEEESSHAPPLKAPQQPGQVNMMALAAAGARANLKKTEDGHNTSRSRDSHKSEEQPAFGKHTLKKSMGHIHEAVASEDSSAFGKHLLKTAVTPSEVPLRSGSAEEEVPYGQHLLKTSFAKPPTPDTSPAKPPTPTQPPAGTPTEKSPPKKTGIKPSAKMLKRRKDSDSEDSW